MRFSAAGENGIQAASERPTPCAQGAARSPGGRVLLAAAGAFAVSMSACNEAGAPRPAVTVDTLRAGNTIRVTSVPRENAT